MSLSKSIYTHVKVELAPRTGHDGPEGEYRYSSTLSSTSALDGGGRSTPRPGHFKGKLNGKGKVHPRTGHEGPE